MLVMMLDYKIHHFSQSLLQKQTFQLVHVMFMYTHHLTIKKH